MENKMYQDDEFEQFLQDEVKQHRMFPSDHIWKNIRTELHGYKAWPALTFISLFIITALTVSTLVSNHPHEQPVLRTVLPVAAEKIQTGSPITAVAARIHKPNYFEQFTEGQITQETFAASADELLAETEIMPVNTLRGTALQPIPAQNKTIDTRLTAKQIVVPAVVNQAVQYTKEPVKENTIAEETAMLKTAAESLTQESIEKQELTTPEPARIDLRTDDPQLKNTYVTNVKSSNRSKFGFQFYITPSTSYRKLSDEKVKEIVRPVINSRIALPNLPPNTTTTADVNNVVRHRPAVGIEVGLALLYNINPRIKFKTGLQLNIRQYHIETFQTLIKEQTSVSLINYRGVETINMYSPYNNNTGYKETRLDNKVYQISMPIGIQWDVLQGRSVGLNVEGSVQPTMTLTNNTYLLSTDYKHYTEGDQLIRKWNINTSVGFNLTYKVGSTSWQIGPQVRYQHLPTYSNAYPITEHLMDYGVRFGFTKQLK
jgi:hypothetical protein